MTTADEPQLAAAEDSGDLASYRPICGMAVVALVLGLFSIVAIMGQVFWGLPLLTIGVAMIALRRIRAADPPMIGRKAAWCGLFLGVLWGGAAVSTHYFQYWIARTQARQVAQQWFHFMLQGNTPRAHQLTMPPDRRELRVNELDAIYQTNPNLEERLTDFMEQSGPAEVVRFNADAQVEYLFTEDQFRDAETEHVMLVYEIADPREERPATRFIINTERKAGDRAGWLVREVFPYSEFLRLSRRAARPQLPAAP